MQIGNIGIDLKKRYIIQMTWHIIKPYIYALSYY